MTVNSGRISATLPTWICTFLRAHTHWDRRGFGNAAGQFDTFLRGPHLSGVTAVKIIKERRAGWEDNLFNWYERVFRCYFTRRARGASELHPSWARGMFVLRVSLRGAGGCDRWLMHCCFDLSPFKEAPVYPGSHARIWIPARCAMPHATMRASSSSAEDPSIGI